MPETLEKTPQTEREIYEALIGLNQQHQFSDAIQQALAEESSPTSIEVTNRQNILESNGIELNPGAAPPSHSLDRISEESWDAISGKESGDQLLAVWSQSNKERLAHKEEQAESSRSIQRQQPREKMSEEAMLRSLPLIHGTTVEGLEAALGQGAFIGNRGVHEAGGDAIGSGATTGTDRELGLDNFVFADFGRPHRYREDNQAEVTVVLAPVAMQQPGSFATEQDIYDCQSANEYMQGLLLPEDFYDGARARIRTSRSADNTYRDRGETFNSPMTIREFTNGGDSDPDTVGNAQFSTWEVKMPEVPTGLIDKIIFRDEAQYRKFIEEHGELEVPVILQSDLAHNLEDVRNNERYEETYAQMVDEDYAKRLGLIEEAEDVQESYVILGQAKPNPGTISEHVTEHCDPKWFTKGKVANYENPDDAVTAARDDKQGWQMRINYTQLLNDSQILPHASQVAVAKIRSSESANASVIDNISWVEI